jgi:hypothetical protein
MMSPQTHVALVLARDRDDVRRAARRPDAIPDPDVRAVEAAPAHRFRRRLERLHLTPARHA